MKKWDTVMLKMFLFGLPLVLLYAVFAYSIDWQSAGADGGTLRLLYDLGGLFLAIWMLLAVIVSLRLVFSSSFREIALVKFTLLREQDERESFLTGMAARETMLTTIAILIFLFCLSCFQVSVDRLPPDQTVDGKTRSLSLGMKFELFSGGKDPGSREKSPDQTIVAYNGLPFSTSSIIAGLTLWQIFAYNRSIRRLMK